MPNYRARTIQHGPHKLRVVAQPRGLRGLPPLRGLLPYVTGNEAQIVVEVTVVEWKVGTQTWVEYACTLGGSEYRGAHGRVDALPLRFVTENAYLSSPGEYQYQLFLKAKDHSETYQMADFSVFAKNRLAA